MSVRARSRKNERVSAGSEPVDPPTSSTAHHAAFERWVLPEIDVMFRVARSITGNDAEAEDLTQDALLRAFRAIDRFDGRHPRAWLLTIVRNTHVNRNRRRRPYLLDDPDAVEERSLAMADPSDGPETLVVDLRFDAEVEAAHRALPAVFREVIDLVDIGGLTYEEAATVLDIPAGTVMSRLHRGRRRLRHALTTPVPTHDPDNDPTPEAA